MLPDTQEPEQEDQEEYYRAYFGNDADYYLDKLARYRAGSKVSFNIGAFFFGILWLLYRKLYLVAVVVFVVVTLESFLLDYVVTNYQVEQSTATTISRGTNLVWGVFVGFLGNWLYLRQAIAKVEKATKAEANEEDALGRLSVQGGITLLPHIILAALVLVYILVGQFT